ncbi:MAG: AAA family ATPase, partial [Candidatus Excrementavichristensenella sp.]
MIKAIRLKNFATYSSMGSSIENCQKVNFFYGPNGSGKSIIGNYLQNSSALQYSDCEIEYENNVAVDVVVYNREFRARNFKENIAGVFTLGQATIEDIQALEKLKEQRTKKEDDCAKRDNTLKKKCQEEIEYKATFRDTVWERILKSNETDFQEAFSGFRNNKERFRDEVLRQYKISHSSSETRDNLLSRAKTLFSQKPEKCDTIPFVLDNIVKKITEIETSSIWSKVIVGNKDLPIGHLIEVLDNADWVNQGRKHLREDGICPFCQQPTITDELKRQLDAFFSGEYEQDINLIKHFISQYGSCTDELLRRINTLKTSLDSYPAASIDLSKLNIIIELLNGYFSKNKAEMLVKEKEPGRLVSLTETATTVSDMEQLIIVGNAAIAKHNNMVDNYTSEKNTLIVDIWAFLMDENEALIAGYLNEINTFRKAQNGIQKGIDECKQQLDDLNDEIGEAGKNITSVQPTVDEINRSLTSYGFTNFKIVPSPVQPNAYQIQRIDGTLATNTLSEGEETFISF